MGSSISGLSGLYTVVMKAAGASRRVFQLLDRTSSMPKSGDKCPLGSVAYIFPKMLFTNIYMCVCVCVCVCISPPKT